MTTTTNARQDCLALPYLVETEAKANMFVIALETVFGYDIVAETFQDGGRWGIAVTEGMDEITDPIQDERIIGVAILMNRFDIVESTGEVMCLDDPGRRISYQEIPAAREALTRRARRAFRIEDKLDRLLAHFEREDGVGDKLDRMHYLLVEEANEVETADEERRPVHADA